MKTKALILTMLAGALCAADHADGPGVTQAPAADITDVYAWMADASHVALVMNVFPSADTTSRFSTTLKYVFHVSSRVQYGTSPGPEVPIICTFDNGTPQRVSCWVGTADYVTGDATGPAGVSSTDGRVKVFTGLRDDPFFFNRNGYSQFRSTVAAIAPNELFDMGGCMQVDHNTSLTLMGQLQSNGMGGAASDYFNAKNVLSIVLQLDKALVATQAQPVLSVWASTNQ